MFFIWTFPDFFSLFSYFQQSPENNCYIKLPRKGFESESSDVQSDHHSANSVVNTARNYEKVIILNETKTAAAVSR